jgi:hypothetical protein
VNWALFSLPQQNQPSFSNPKAVPKSEVLDELSNYKNLESGSRKR